jgi:predicted ATPase
MSLTTPLETYQDRRATFVALLEAAERRSTAISQARFVVFLLLLIPLLAFEGSGSTGRLALVGLGAALVAVFAGLVVAHGRSRDRERWLQMRVLLCDEGIRRIERDWTDLPDLGDPPPEDHPYAHDLDLFGHASLSALLGSVGTTPGRYILRHWLLQPSGHEEARARQPAVGELADHQDLRETLSAWGRIVGWPTAASLAGFLDWCGREDPLPTWVTVVSYGLPVVSLTSLAAWWMGWIGLGVLLVPGLAAVGLNLRFVPRFNRTFEEVSRGEVSLAHYARLFRPIADARFETPLLRSAQERLGAGGVSAPDQLARLLRLVHLSDSRRNAMFHWVLQLLFLWDFHVARGLVRWKAECGHFVADWIRTLGEVDALGALAALRFENPDWAVPTLEDAGDVIDAKALVHPYLSSIKGVRNDVRVGPAGTFLLVTGSNMSGKSTLLRAIGVNVVLARAGAPVAAEALRLPPVRLETSMRVHDSLEEGISFFMAELRRLKGVVDAARQEGASVLYLLDEILQGTNTVERQIAARTVVRSLLDAGAIGAVTTHDLHLADAPDLHKRSHAVHFQETFGRDDQGPTLDFDYRLRPGIAQSTNALALMELVGLGRARAELEAEGPPHGAAPPRSPPSPMDS